MTNHRFHHSQIHPVGGVEALLLTCLLRPDDEQFGEAITCFLFGPDVLVPFVLTRILWPQRGKQTCILNTVLAEFKRRIR